ncbi:LAMI_0A04170g1_1 [Lachancea mirantina]|uniref:LAMI_0A04170g1_1 n=1 Tax=Lachancea mirantina TaxID=1230905 RepID=A0A1G4IPB4_9SACH|nr:LAMI_0A04170g1_1 [Lachancea mirantina]
MNKVILLKNKTIPIDHYDTIFRTGGYEPVFLPLIQHTHVSEEILYLLQDEAYLKKLDIIIITSQRAVECLNESVIPQLDKCSTETLFNKTLYTVGPATQNFLVRSGFKRVHGGASTGNGSALADLLISDLYKSNLDPKSCKVLFLVGETRRDIIPKKLNKEGIEVEEIVTYKTETLLDNVIRFKKEFESIDWVAFFSPQGTEGIVEYLRSKGNPSVASIGPTTETYLQSKGLKPTVVSEKPDATSLLSSINEARKKMSS